MNCIKLDELIQYHDYRNISNKNQIIYTNDGFGGFLEPNDQNSRGNESCLSFSVHK